MSDSQQCPPGSFDYTVQAGDTFFNLARRFNTTVDSIRRTNPGVNPDRLAIGQLLCIPTDDPSIKCPPGTTPYEIRAGDTFYSIARRVGITVDALIESNPGVNPDRLQVGQIICVPPQIR